MASVSVFFWGFVYMFGCFWLQVNKKLTNVALSDKKMYCVINLEVRDGPRVSSKIQLLSISGSITFLYDSLSHQSGKLID